MQSSSASGQHHHVHVWNDDENQTFVSPVPPTEEALPRSEAPQTPQRQRPTLPAPTTPASLTSSVAAAAWVASASASSGSNNTSNATLHKSSSPPFPVHSPPRNQTQKDDEATHLVAQTLQSLSVHQYSQSDNNNSSSMEEQQPNPTTTTTTTDDGNTHNHMMGMRAGCPSPAHSHVSTGSSGFGPTCTTRYDLTPITRNTSLTFLDHTSGGGGDGRSEVSTVGGGGRGVPITPPHHLDNMDAGLLHGEHLTMPSAYAAVKDNGRDGGEDIADGGFFRRATTSLLRRSSRSRDSSSHHEDDLLSPFSLVPQPPPASSSSQQQPFLVAPGLPGHHHHRNTSPPVVPLQPQRKFHTFTTREQYEAAMVFHQQHDDDDDDDDALFQASSDEEELGTTTARRDLRPCPYTPSHRLGDDDDDDDDGPGASAFDDIFKNDSSIPLEQVPSLRLAHPMYGGGSTTSLSYTGGEETDEDSLVHMTNGGGRVCSSNDDSFTVGMQYNTDGEMIATNSCAGNDSDTRMLLDEDDDEGPPNNDFDLLPAQPLFSVLPPPDLIRNRKKRKTPRRERQARAWLQEIQGDAGCVVEAASSVFLRQQQQIPPQQKSSSLELRRQASAPST